MYAGAAPFKIYEPDLRPYAPRVSTGVWDAYRECLSSLHAQRFTRAQMLDYLADHYDFRPSKQQLNVKMMEWGYRVYPRSSIQEPQSSQSTFSGAVTSSANRPKASLGSAMSSSGTLQRPDASLPDTEDLLQTSMLVSPLSLTNMSDQSPSLYVEHDCLEQQDWFLRCLTDTLSMSDDEPQMKHDIEQDLKTFSFVLQRWPVVIDQCWPIGEYLRPTFHSTDTDSSSIKALLEDMHRSVPRMRPFLKWSRSVVRNMGHRDFAAGQPSAGMIGLPGITQELICHLIVEWLALSEDRALMSFSDHFREKSVQSKLKIFLYLAATTSLLAVAIMIEIGNMLLGPDNFSVMSAKRVDWIASLDKAYGTLIGLDEAYVRHCFPRIVRCALSEYAGFQLISPRQLAPQTVQDAFSSFANALVHKTLGQSHRRQLSTRSPTREGSHKESNDMPFPPDRGHLGPAISAAINSSDSSDFASFKRTMLRLRQRTETTTPFNFSPVLTPMSTSSSTNDSWGFESVTGMPRRFWSSMDCEFY